jgi:hypothetical protein
MMKWAVMMAYAVVTEHLRPPRNWRNITAEKEYM